MLLEELLVMMLLYCGLTRLAWGFGAVGALLGSVVISTDHAFCIQTEKQLFVTL